MEYAVPQMLLLLAAAVAVVVGFHRLNIPSSLGYLLVGVLLGPHTAGPVVHLQQVGELAELGIVFLLFTTGLNYSLPQINALRSQVLTQGAGQVLMTTVCIGVVGWLAGLPAAAAFVIGAVFAQSSTTIIVKQLNEQGEQDSRHGRLGTAISVFQDVTAVPFVVVIPALGTAAAASTIALDLGWAAAKAVLAFVLVIVLGRWLLRPLFHLVAELRSAEVFTLTVLLVSLAAGWTTEHFGLSMAFGAFLAGMMLGETEFRHQVEATIRPFRDVLLGLFFVGIGMLFDPALLPAIWPWALAGALALLASKLALVTLIVRYSGVDLRAAVRTGLVVAVGGEFGFALLAIALGAGVIDERTGQIALTAVLFSMIAAPFLIRHNRALTAWIGRTVPRAEQSPAPRPAPATTGRLSGHVIICGYGRIGQSVANLLEVEGIPHVALDLDPARVREAHTAGEPAFYGDASERDILEAVGIATARLIVISHSELPAARKVLDVVRSLRPDLPVMVRTRDETHVEELRAAGATEVVPETLEAGLMIATHALLLLGTPLSRIVRRIQSQRSERYRLLREVFLGDPLTESAADANADRLRVVVLGDNSTARGRSLAELSLDGVAVTAVVRNGQRRLSPPLDTRLEAGDALVLFGSPEDLQAAEQRLLTPLRRDKH
ncbi:cation:proton antiporter [Fontimonas sp. SYSU GA230001]|uniref:cation:proton antiporter domain-containing protein n=1 Tax=Fontimonas sp. SYSU GA230001 TaxID=3142450 RepID=UPI0032B35701